MKLTTVIFCTACAISFFACRKENFITSEKATIAVSSDTLFFDTVFATKGSITRSVKIYNTNDQKLKLSKVKLAGGSTSPFKINIDGVSAPELDNVEMNANDSLYIFVQVNVDPNDELAPFVVSDSIQISYNGNTQWMQLRAYGQNAIFFKNVKITENTVWTDSLPYVVTGAMQVDTGVTLHLNPGSRVYVHATAPIIIYGSIQSAGTAEEPVIFSGDRRDEDYRDLPAAWPGLYLMPSSENNFLRHTVVRNAYQGIVMQGIPGSGDAKLKLSQSVLENIYDAGILAINSAVEADNSLIANCGSNVALLMGGKHTFTNCTVASYGNIYLPHKNPVLQVTDFFEQGGTLYTSGLAATFTNCIFWGDNGSVADELFLGKKGSDFFDVRFVHSIYKAENAIKNGIFNDCLVNTPPLFDSINTAKNIYDFHFNLNPASPARNAGVPTPYLYDLDGILRDGQPDIGCYEYR